MYISGIYKYLQDFIRPVENATSKSRSHRYWSGFQTPPNDVSHQHLTTWFYHTASHRVYPYRGITGFTGRLYLMVILLYIIFIAIFKNLLSLAPSPSSRSSSQTRSSTATTTISASSHHLLPSPLWCYFSTFIIRDCGHIFRVTFHILSCGA